ncbi:MAG: hypothetical protein FWE49_01800 [Synergistaceae bacterium]|nr:hypothetical protein [Synergistaceae bacterium]
MIYEGERKYNAWPAPNTISVIVFEICAIIFFIYLINNEDGYAGILDNFNLIIHEAGHVIFSLFGQTMHLLGGTLLECIVPIAFLISFWRSRQPVGVAFSGIWLGENFLYISRYILDAMPMKLPLLGGANSIHDWNAILGSWDILHHYKIIGNTVFVLGWIIMIISAIWYFLMWLLYHGFEDRAEN